MLSNDFLPVYALTLLLFVLYLVSLVSSLQRNGKIICSHSG